MTESWVGVKIFDRESPQSGNIGDVFTTFDFYHNLTEAAWCGAMDGAQLWDQDFQEMRISSTDKQQDLEPLPLARATNAKTRAKKGNSWTSTKR